MASAKVVMSQMPEKAFNHPLDPEFLGSERVCVYPHAGTPEVGPGRMFQYRYCSPRTTKTAGRNVFECLF